MEFEDETMRGAMQQLVERFEAEKANTEKFRNQLLYLLHQNDQKKLLERLDKGSAYYAAFMDANLKMLLQHLAEVEQFSRTKKYQTALGEVEQFIVKSLAEIEKVKNLATAIIRGEEYVEEENASDKRIAKREAYLQMARNHAKTDPRFEGRTKTGKKKKGQPNLKLAKGKTYETTYALINEGMSLKEIAETRGLALSTIEGHAVKGIKEKKIEVEQVLPSAIIKVVSQAFQENSNINKVFESLDKNVSYDILRMVRASEED